MQRVYMRISFFPAVPYSHPKNQPKKSLTLLNSCRKHLLCLLYPDFPYRDSPGKRRKKGKKEKKTLQKCDRRTVDVPVMAY